MKGEKDAGEISEVCIVNEKNHVAYFCGKVLTLINIKQES
jgi:hypothetical protein